MRASIAEKKTTWRALLQPGIRRAVVVLLFPLAFHQIGKSITFGFLAAMALAQAIFMRLFVPETKNKPWEEVEEFGKAGAPSRHENAQR